MENTINFGIDLGTTNSAIARFVKGEVQVFNNPSDYGRSTLPSVVGYRKDKIITGTKAKELIEKEPRNVVSAFKRRMGTTESYKIKATGQSVTPVDLSALVLKELKTFLPQGEALAAAVITIPASFDTIQSNATKEAGLQAGIGQVVLLQEPIAASLAYANQKKEKQLPEGQWLVYDLGGGTFDVALVRIQDGEMKVIDHEGDNYLGGYDFDRLIVEKLFVPKLEAQYRFDNLANDLKSEKGRLNAKYYVFLNAAEKAKIALSNSSSAEVEIEGFQDDDEQDVSEELTITRSEFNDLIKDSVDRTVGMVKEILTRNNLQARDLLFTLMVGGSTYSPFVRERVGEALGTPVNTDIDPTTAVAVGAAYYAGTKLREAKGAVATKAATRLQVKTSYQKSSRETEELFSARITGDISGLSYRITRLDGGFDTGLKKLTERISEDLPLVADTFNMFRFVVYDAQNNVVATNDEDIAINSGYSISGQPLPEDICLEVDDEDQPGKTKLLCVFERMTPLPARRTITKRLNKPVMKGSADEVIHVKVLEGSKTSLAVANKNIGYLPINGRNLNRDVQRGSDIEITIEMSESRDLTVTAYLAMIDQEFREIFSPKVRSTSVALVQQEASDLDEQIEDELQKAEEREDYEAAAALKKLRREANGLSEEVGDLMTDDVTDKKFQLEDRKRKLAQQFHEATRDKHLAEIRTVYEEEKEACRELVDKHGNDQEQKYLRDVEQMEASALSSGHMQRVQELISKLSNIRYGILWRLPAFLTGVFQNMERQAPRMNDQVQAERLVKDGRRALQGQDWTGLRSINSQLINLLPRAMQDEMKVGKIGF